MTIGFVPGSLSDLGGLCAALYCGLAIGLLYDLFRLLRLPAKSPWITGIIDGLFYLLALCLAWVTMLYINCGTVRLYVFLTIGLGIYLYVRFPGRLLCGMAAALKEKFTKKQLHTGK